LAFVQPLIKIELDPNNPVPEICAVIAAVLPYHPNHKKEIIQGVMEACQKQLAMKGVKQDAGELQTHNRNKPDK